jgi:hypothetical protein
VWVKWRTAERVLRQAAATQEGPATQHLARITEARISHQINDADASGFDPQRGELTKPRPKAWVWALAFN